MNYSGIKYADMINGRGIRVSLFVSGCSHGCEACFNIDTWNPEFGERFTERKEREILEYFQKYRATLSGLSLLGGDPTYKKNRKPLTEFVKKFKNLFPEKDIWIWSGYSWEEIVADRSLLDLISLCDVLVDGKFNINKKNPNLKWRGSENQRVIDVQKSLADNCVSEYIS